MIENIGRSWGIIFPGMLSKTQVKYIQSLYQKKFRDETGLFVVEGPKIVHECCLAAPAEITAIYALKDWAVANAQLLQRISPDKIIEAEPADLERISSQKTPNQVMAVMQKRPEGSLNFNNTITLLLSTIQDPGNLGTIVRIADWFNVSNIVCSPDSVELYNPKVIQSSMGSFLRVNVAYQPLEEVIDAHPEIPLYATALDGTDISKLPPVQEGFVLIGNESRGLEAQWLNKAKEKITIPKWGQAESLNAAVATGIVLFQLRKRD